MLRGFTPSIDFLKKSKMEGIGARQGVMSGDRGGNSAVDAARSHFAKGRHGRVPLLSSFA
jgi:hypothetical protein